MVTTNKKYDCIVVGAGPAGLVCATTLARGGQKTLVIEKGKRTDRKVCAEGLTIKNIDLVPNLLLPDPSHKSKSR